MKECLWMKEVLDKEMRPGRCLVFPYSVQNCSVRGWVLPPALVGMEGGMEGCCLSSSMPVPWSTLTSGSVQYLNCNCWALLGRWCGSGQCWACSISFWVPQCSCTSCGRITQKSLSRGFLAEIPAPKVQHIQDMMTALHPPAQPFSSLIQQQIGSNRQSWAITRHGEGTAQPSGTWVQKVPECFSQTIFKHSFKIGINNSLDYVYQFNKTRYMLNINGCS